MSALDEVVAEDGTIFRRGKAVCEAADARAELSALREERDALRERLADVELVLRWADSMFTIPTDRGSMRIFSKSRVVRPDLSPLHPKYAECRELTCEVDGTGLPLLTPEARAALRGEVKT